MSEILNDNDFYKDYEIIGGEEFMAPSATIEHSYIIGRLHFCFVSYFLEHKTGYVLSDDIDVHFSDGSIYKPDLVVVLKSNEKILAGHKAIYGVPDMVVEVLSRSTRKKDLTIKKDTYEAQGVREYWIVDPRAKIVSVYLLRDGKYYLDDEYILFGEEDVEEIEWLKSKGQPVEIKHEIPVSIVEGLKIPLEFVFSWGY